MQPRSEVSESSASVLKKPVVSSMSLIKETGSQFMRVLIADDHGMVRDTIASFLASEGDVQVLTAHDLDSALSIIEEQGRFDLVLLDFNMPGMNGLSGLQRGLERFPNQQFAILSGSAPSRTAQEALDVGALGFLPKSMGAQSLLNAIRFMATGETYVPAELMRAEADVIDHPLKEQLSSREIEVLNGLCRGLSNKEIARELDLQEVTIKLHVRTLCRKVEAKNRTHAAMIAKEAGLF